MFSIGDIIDLAIRIEENGEEAYRKAQGLASAPALKVVLGWLADQEKEHQTWFAALRETLDTVAVSDDLEAAARQILKSILGGQTFSLAEGEIEAKETLDDIIKTALEFENDTIVFYEMINEFVQEKRAKQGLKSIIEEEKGHAKSIKDYLEKIKIIAGDDVKGGV